MTGVHLSGWPPQLAALAAGVAVVQPWLITWRKQPVIIFYSASENAIILSLSTQKAKEELDIRTE